MIDRNMRGRMAKWMASGLQTHPSASGLLSVKHPAVSLGRYIPKYFILFVAMVNGIVSLISLSVFSLLLYSNERDFSCVYFISCNYIH